MSCKNILQLLITGGSSHLSSSFFFSILKIFLGIKPTYPTNKTRDITQDPWLATKSMFFRMTWPSWPTAPTPALEDVLSFAAATQLVMLLAGPPIFLGIIVIYWGHKMRIYCIIWIWGWPDLWIKMNNIYIYITYIYIVYIYDIEKTHTSELSKTRPFSRVCRRFWLETHWSIDIFPMNNVLKWSGLSHFHTHRHIYICNVKWVKIY